MTIWIAPDGAIEIHDWNGTVTTEQTADGGLVIHCEEEERWDEDEVITLGDKRGDLNEAHLRDLILGRIE